MLQFSLKRLTPVITSAILLASCSSSKQTASVPERNDVKGTWLLDRITYDGIPSGQKLKLTLLDEGDDACLTGSTWVFPNNGNGSYTIANSGAGCTSGQRNIVWSYQKNGDQPQLQVKRMEGGVKAKDITDGYRFKIISVNETSLTLQSEVSYQGSPIYINYLFSKK